MNCRDVGGTVGWGTVRSEVKEEARASAWAGGHERSTVPQSLGLAVTVEDKEEEQSDDYQG